MLVRRPARPFAVIGLSLTIGMAMPAVVEAAPLLTITVTGTVAGGTDDVGTLTGVSGAVLDHRSFTMVQQLTLDSGAVTVVDPGDGNDSRAVYVTGLSTTITLDGSTPVVVTNLANQAGFFGLIATYFVDLGQGPELQPQSILTAHSGEVGSNIFTAGIQGYLTSTVLDSAALLQDRLLTGGQTAGLIAGASLADGDGVTSYAFYSDDLSKVQVQYTDDVTPVPEAPSSALLGIGLLGLALALHRHRGAAQARVLHGSAA